MKMPESQKWYQLAPPPPPPPSHLIESTNTTMEHILNDLINDILYGFAKVWIHVPEELQSRFSEFPPIFKNEEIKLEDIGEHMKSFCDKIGRKICVYRSLIISMHAHCILLLTPLLKKYLQMGLVVTRIELVISYNRKPVVFDWFVEEVCNDRRRADQGGAEFKIKGEASKLKGNCGYWRVLMDKSKHTRLSFAKAENHHKHVSNPFLKIYDELNEGIFEVAHDLPLQKRYASLFVRQTSYAGILGVYQYVLGKRHVPVYGDGYGFTLYCICP